MATSQTKDKKLFFDDLERLGESDSESDQNEVLPLISNGKSLPQKHVRHPTTVAENIHGSISMPTVVPVAAAESAHPKERPGMTMPEVIDLTSPVFKTTSNPPASVPIPASPTPALKRRTPATTSAASYKRQRKGKNDVQLVPRERQIFGGLVFFFIPNDDIVKSRKLRILRTREHGGHWARDYDETVTHIIVEPQISYTEAQKAFDNHQIPKGKIVVRSTWFSESLTSMYLRDVLQSRFRLLGAPVPETMKKSPSRVSDCERIFENENTQVVKHTSEVTKLTEMARPSTTGEAKDFDELVEQARHASQFPMAIRYDEYESFGSIISETSFETASSAENTHCSGRNQGFMCMESNDGTNDDNQNVNTINILQEMATYYDHTGDHWRTTAYRKAISALRKQKDLVSTREEALAIPQIGNRLAEKIEEIVVTNRLRRLESAQDNPHAKILQLFMGVYDAGYKQASQWIAQGHRTLDDVLQKASPSQNQKIGIAHYDDFLTRIPRAEVKCHGEIVRRACKAVDKDIEVIVGGSYRRGSADSGDIDLIITKPDADISHIRALLINHIIPALFKSSFLKCRLSSIHSPLTSSTGSKWHGASCLPASTTWRRIDFLFVPSAELGAAMIYFTGNDIFNRSIRLLASRKGMRLNQHGLFKGVMRGEGRVKITEGTLVEARSERKIFEVLGVPWREPWERKC